MLLDGQYTPLSTRCAFAVGPDGYSAIKKSEKITGSLEELGAPAEPLRGIARLVLERDK